MHNTTFPNVRNNELSLRTFFMFAIILLLAISATWWFTRHHYNNTEATDRVFFKLDSSLVSYNSFLRNNNRAIADEMDEKLKDPAGREKALLWNPKAKSALILTQNIQQFIQEIKNDLKGSNEYRELDSRTSSFYKRNVADKLFDSLKNFDTHLINLVPKNKIRQLSMLPTQALISNKQFNNKEIWKETYFKNLSNTAINAMLSKIELDVLRSASIVLNYMNEQNESSIHYCEFYLPLISQNSMVLMPGQTLEITADIGAYSSMTNPKIKINNMFIPMNEFGNGVYKKTITSSKGATMPVVISYIDPNTGELRTVSKSITYAVFQSTKN